MALSVNNLRKNTLFNENGKVYLVLDYHHHKMGRAKATIRVRARDVKSGNISEFTYNNNASVEEVNAIRRNYRFVYFDERKNQAVLSHPDTKERITVSNMTLGKNEAQYLSTGTPVQLLVDLEANEILAAELPTTVEMKIEQTGPSDKGDTAGAARKAATLESGLVIQVPMFIKTGETIRLNTQTGEYIERVS